jgi:hypothetical protein
MGEKEGKRMALNPPEILRDRGKALEDEFFHRQNQRLLERLSERKAAESTRDALAKASGITTPAVLDELIKLGIRADTVAALSIVPLLEVAWADGTLDAKERRAVIDTTGLAPGSTVATLIEGWLDRRPDPRLFIAWTHLVQAMCEQLGPSGAAKLKAGLLERAAAVAAASGGRFGIGSKVSSSEAAALARLEAAFGPTR